MSKGRYCLDCGSPVPPSGRCDCGWIAKGKGNQETIEPYPEECCVDGCDNDTTQTFAVGVYRGVTMKAYAGKFLYQSAGSYLTRQDCSFVEWVTRCNECCLREADVKGITRFKEAQVELEIQKANPTLPEEKIDHVRIEKEALAEIKGLTKQVAEHVRMN